MNKYLLLSAVAALASTAAQAGTAAYSFSFGSNCDGGTVYTNGSSIWAWKHHGCDGTDSNGSGRVGKQGASFKGADMSDNLIAKNYLSYFEAINFLLPKKIRNGAPWEADVSFSGTTAFFLTSGVLTNVTRGDTRIANHGGISTLQSVQGLLAARKAKLSPR